MAVRLVRIDFSGARPAPPAWALLLFAVGAALCITAVWRGSAIGLRETRAMADVERARGALTAHYPVAVARVSMSEAQVDAINNAIVQLNLPWQALFESLEKVKPQNIALLGLEPDGKKRVLRILAETRQAEDMLDFVRLLRQQPQFADATLIKHEIYAQDPNRPLRFAIEATWKASL